MFLLKTGENPTYIQAAILRQMYPPGDPIQVQSLTETDNPPSFSLSQEGVVTAELADQFIKLTVVGIGSVILTVAWNGMETQEQIVVYSPTGPGDYVALKLLNGGQYQSPPA